MSRINIHNKAIYLVRLIIPIICLFSVISCGGGTSETKPDNQSKIEIPITASGGVVTWSSPDNNKINASLTIPADALNSDTTISVQESNESSTDYEFLSGSVLDFGPNGLVFNEPAEMVFKYDPDLLGNVDEIQLALYKLSNGTWNTLPSTLDTTTHTLTADVNGFSVFAIGFPKISDIESNYTVSGTLSGLSSGTLDIQLNNTEDLALNSNGSFEFAMLQETGWVYEVIIVNQPENQLCSITNDAGTIETSDVTDVSINCVNNAFTVSGSVSGMTGGTLELQLNNTENFTINNNGDFEFAMLQQPGWVYEIVVVNHPENQICSITNGGGTVATSNITDVSISCESNVYTVSGSVTGMTGGTLVANLNNTEDLSVTENGDFEFSMLQQNGWVYEVIVQDQPLDQLCTVSNGGGTISGAHITDVTINCVRNIFTLGGEVSGLVGTLEIQNYVEALVLNKNGSYVFATKQEPNWAFDVIIAKQPKGQVCSIENYRGTVPTADITDVNITCENIYTVGGVVSGLIGSMTIENGIGESKKISSNGEFKFDSTVVDGSDYIITIQNQPNGQECSVTNESGTVTAANVTDILIDCISPPGWKHPADADSYINVTDAGGNAVMAMNNNGQAIAAWTASDGSTDCGESGGNACLQVYISQYENGSWTPVPSLSDNISPDGFNAAGVQVAIGDNGDAIVVWKMNTAWASLCHNVTFQCSRIFMSEYRNGSWTHPADMDSFIDPPNVNNVSLTPKVAMDSSGNAIIVWRNYAGGVFKSEYRNGAWIHPESITDDIPNSIWNPSVAMDNNGNALIVWQSDDSNYHDRLYLSEYRNGIWSHPSNLETDAINPPGQANCPGITCPIPVKIAMDNNGNSIIVWDQRTTSYTDYEDGVIFKSEYRDGAWSHPVSIDDNINPGIVTDWARYPEVAMDDNDNAIIVWRQNDDTSDCDVVPPGFYASRPAPCKQLFISEYRNGSWTNPMSKSDHISIPGQPVRSTSAIQMYSVAMANNGEAVVAWSQDIPSLSCGADDRQVYVSTYREGGWSHPASLADNLIELDIISYSPVAKMDNEGTILLGWNSFNNIYFSEYRCPGCPQELPQIIAPRNLQATAADGQVNLSWHEVSNAHSYNIYWSENDSATTSDNKISGVTGGSYEHTERTNKMSYSYLITAVIPGIESLPSDEVSARPSACIGCPEVLNQTSLMGTPKMDEGQAVTFDTNGNVYVAGSTGGALDGNTYNGSFDAFITKYDADGVKLWTVQQGTAGLEIANDIAVDTASNSYITGNGILLSKYSTEGVLDPQWSKQAAGTTGYGVAIDPAGNIYITGSTSANLVYPVDEVNNAPHGNLDIFISKYNSSGVLQWTVQPGTVENDQGNAIAVDTQGNVYVTGVTNSGLDGNIADGYEDIFITKYNTSGVRLWTKQVDPTTINTYKEVGTGIALDANNNIYITGYTSGKFFENHQRGWRDVIVMKYDTNGCMQWTRQRGVSGTFTYGYGISADAKGNVFITGETQGALDDNIYNGEQDIFIMKFNTKGIHDWTKQYGEAGMDFGNGIAVDENGNFFTTGATDGNLEGQQNNGDGSLYIYDAFMMRHDSAE